MKALETVKGDAKADEVKKGDDCEEFGTPRMPAKVNGEDVQVLLDGGGPRHFQCVVA